jgi:hypothetical protein
MEAFEMKLFLCGGRSALAAALLSATLAAGPALADDAAPAKTPAPAAAPASEPSQAQMDLAKKILIAAGLKNPMDAIVPTMLAQLQTQLLQIHPEMGKTLHEVLLKLMPEFNKGEEDVFTDSARPLARALTEAELQETLTFFNSPAGKKYTGAQSQILDAFSAAATAWRQKLTTVMLDRTREEMKKKGFSF